MGFFKKIFKQSAHRFNHTGKNGGTNKIYENNDIENTSIPVKHENIQPDIPLWKSIPSDENREIDKRNNVDYKKVRIIFDDGNIQDVVPDVNNYYCAEIYCINGIDYNITDIDSINSIPVPDANSKPLSSSLGTPVYRLEYLLRVHAGMAKDEGNKNLAYALMHKGTQLLKYSNLDWKRQDYLREYYWLLDDGRIEDARSFFSSIESDLPAPYSEKESIKEIQHYNYAMLKRFFPEKVPKSFSAYMRNYNKKDSKYNDYVKLAQSINITIN